MTDDGTYWETDGSSGGACEGWNPRFASCVCGGVAGAAYVGGATDAVVTDLAFGADATGRAAETESMVAAGKSSVIATWPASTFGPEDCTTGNVPGIGARPVSVSLDSGLAVL